MGDGTQESPYTREDVRRLIEKNGGKAEGLDLSGKIFENDIDLRGLDLDYINLDKASLVSRISINSDTFLGANLQGTRLEHAYLKEAFLSYVHLEGAHLWDAHLEGAHLAHAYLEGADLSDANLEEAELGDAHLQGADLSSAYLKGADLSGAYLEGADLRYTTLEDTVFRGAHLEGAYLSGIEFTREINLDKVDWGNYILGEERKGRFIEAEVTYRRLKQWYTNAGVYDIAGEFFFREMTVQRKRILWWPHPAQRKGIRWLLHPRHRAWSKFVSIICGYGERPQRVISWAISWIVGLALIYLAIGSIWEWWAFWNYLYFSAVSFTALGYGSWLWTNNDWIKGIGAFESFVGVFSIALFLVTFTRKMRR